MPENQPMPEGGIDPGVKVPPSVARASAAADQLHQQAYKPPEKPVDPPVTVAVTDPPAVVTDPPRPPDPAPKPADAGEPGSWEHRYHSMKGRFDQSQVMIGQMQEQMGQLGDELIRSQQAFINREIPREPQRGDPPPAHVRLTDSDIQTYGPELIDLIRRAALDAVAPELGKTVQAVKGVTQRVQQTTALSLHQRLDTDVPDWRTINTDPAFKAWCSLPDVYSGVLRGNLLKSAFQAADAPRVVAFFKGYKAEQAATGQLPVPAQGQQPVTEAPARQAAVELGSLVAPGRAKPAPGESAASAAEKPIFTRADIQNFYRLVRTGHYNGREPDKQRDEAMIFAAQREGRVKG